MVRTIPALATAVAAALLTSACECGEGPADDAGGLLLDGSFPDVVVGDAGDELDAGGMDRDSETPMLDGGTPPDECVAEDLCGDGLDNDCDAMVDEACACEPGRVASCYRGPPSTREVGACMDGSYVCMGAFEFGMWGPCMGDVTPAPELCDMAGVDEDCDGASNEDCECFEGDPPLPCGTDEGECQMGIQRCVEGRRTACEGSVGPATETCDGLDEDCDGTIDEGLLRACGSSVGICRMGTQSCDAGAWGECTGGVSPTDEACDGLDNDCDMMTDEGVTRACGSDTGRCVAGLETCDAGTFGPCVGRVDAIAEACNMVDDDCDGRTDEGLTRACGTSDVGACMRGTETCGAAGWGSCLGAVGPATEICEGSVDEDCDGNVDESCACTNGATRPCGTDVGACVAGTETCSMGAWGTCSGRVGPVAESCNGADDDCDGRTDESLSRSCGVTSLGVCTFGTETCSAGSYGACLGAINPGTEACDGLLDEDCDGLTDEGCNCVTGAMRPCGTSAGECTAGTETCDVAGRWGSCVGAVGPSAESCNNLDDDCDTRIDESVVRACGTNTGECVAGTETCSAGMWGACVGSTGPSPDLCEGVLDEDCDGAVDEGCGCTAGAMRPCGSSTGACVSGSQTCDVTGTWGTCTGGVGPSPELCDGTVDEDCDSLVDEGCNCTTGATRPCGSSTGACVPGTETCDATGNWGSCVGAIGPTAEVCNDGDDDCDGSTDEGLMRACGSSVGACTTGTETCSAGAWGMCTGGTGPSGELCDGTVDEDCDGSVDEGCLCTDGQTRSCGTSTGACVSGTETCDLMGVWGSCTGSVGPTAETCNNTDDDCDGSTDESLSRSCGTDVGACTSGTETCSMGTWGSCAGSVGPGTEACDGSVDEDCDGSVDEGCLCTNGQTRPCGSDVGECVAGTETCDLMGSWGPCAGDVGPATEGCNGLDDDCDGSVDEAGVCLPPIVTCPADQTTTVGTPVTLSGSGSDPDGGSVSYAWMVVSAPVGSSATPSSPGSSSTMFTPDEAGSYTLSLCVTDDEMETSCCTVQVTAMSACTPPSTPVLTTCGTSWDRRPVVELTPVPAGVDYELWVMGSSTPYATVTMTGQNYHRPATELGPGGPPPGTAISIYARACLESDPTCCATSSTVTTHLVQTCAMSIGPTPTNVVFSEYVTNGDGPCAGPDCEAGEAIEITNLSHCPVNLDGYHFSYCNPSSCGAHRWMNFGPTDIIPPRGVYVAIRNQAGSMCSYPFFGPDDPSLFGLRISTLSMMGNNLSSGWFNNSGGGMSTLRIASGMFVDMTTGTTIDIISPYSGAAPECSSIGFDAYDQCGDISAVSTPTTTLTPNQLGRLWEPCDAVTAPVPSPCM